MESDLCEEPSSQQSSVVDESCGQNEFVLKCLFAAEHGTCVEIDPNDVWISILAVLASKNVSDFVKNNYWKENRENTEDTQYFCSTTTNLDKNCKCLKSDEVRKFIIPDFTTTTDIHRLIATNIVLGSNSLEEVQVSSSFCFHQRLHSVKMLGSEDDWKCLLEKAKQIPSFSYFSDRDRWSTLLNAAIENFTKTFQDNRDFWCDMVFSIKDYVGGFHTTGWITIFMTMGESSWDHERKCFVESSWGPCATHYAKSDYPFLPYE